MHKISLKAELSFYKCMNLINRCTNPEPMHRFRWTNWIKLSKSLTDVQITLKHKISYYKFMNGTNEYTNPEPMYALNWTDAWKNESWIKLFKPMCFTWTGVQIVLKAELRFYKCMNGMNWCTNTEPIDKFHWTDTWNNDSWNKFFKWMFFFPEPMHKLCWKLN